jgi:eukaryotic-like serine/threonine-protein kinase
MTQTAQVIGTAQYLSPEQARGERVDARSDLYSTGCLLYELLVGRPPFTGDSPVAIAYQHVKEDPVPPSRLDPEVPAWADAIVLKAMEKNPADRYQSAGEMRSDIQRALSGAPLAAPMPGNGYGPGTRRMGSTATQVAGRTTAIPGYRYGPEDGGPDGPPQRQRRVWPWVALGTVVVLLVAAIVLFKFINGNSGGVAVPNVIGETLPVAEHNITSAGFKVGTLTPKQSSVAKNDVISTNPSFGSSESRGSSVNIVYSTGPKAVPTVQVPDVTGLKRNAAITELKAAGFKWAIVPYQSTSAAPNTVIRYSPQGSQPRGSVITLFVNGSTVTVPADVICKSPQAAYAELSSSPYSFLVTTQQGSSSGNGSCPVGTVYQTSPATGTALQPGSPVTIFVVAASQTPTPTVTPSVTPSVTPTATP